MHLQFICQALHRPPPPTCLSTQPKHLPGVITLIPRPDSLSGSAMCYAVCPLLCYAHSLVCVPCYVHSLCLPPCIRHTVYNVPHCALSLGLKAICHG